MSYGMGLGSGLKALTAARLGLQTAGHNIANVNTQGYTRQRVLQSASAPFTFGRGLQIGSGVDIDTISRLIDDGVQNRLRSQVGTASSAEVDQSRWKEIEGLFDEPNGGISNALTDLFGRVGKLQTDPQDRALRGGIVQAGKTLAQNFNLLSGRIEDLSQSTGAEVQSLVTQVNQLASQIANLNGQILAFEGGGGEANDLRDTREQAIVSISKLMNTQALPRKSGSVDIQAGGYLLVSGGQASSLSVSQLATGTEVTIANGSQALDVTSGRIGALLRHEHGEGPELVSKLDSLAKNIALEWNRLHTTGVPRTGPFTTLRSHFAALDGNNNGIRSDELLTQAGLPFDVKTGELYVSVTNKSTGDIERTKISIDPASMTLAQFASKIDAIPNITASVDPTGRLLVNADSGYGFDFANRLDASPDTFGSLGGAAPSIASAVSGPFALTVPAAFTVTIDGTPSAVSLAASDFANPLQATTDELVTAINTQIGTAGTAKNVGGRLVIRSNSSGTTASMSLTDGANSPLAALRLATGTTRTGTARSVATTIEGPYTGTSNGQLLFVADGDGQIGVTPGLTITAYDTNGTKVATLNVGRGYSPLDKIDVVDGVKVSFGAGTISGTAKDVFQLDVLSDSDTSDVLVALGMNSFFWGSKAGDLQVSKDVEANLDLFAGDLESKGGDNLARMMGLREQKLASLDDASIEDYYRSVVGDVGFTTASAQSQLTAENQLLEELQKQRDSVSGVNLDEEAVDLTRYQQAYEAAARYISAVQTMTATLFQLGR